MENKEKKFLQLLAKVEKYTSKDNEQKEFIKYIVVVSGIELALQPADNTVRQVLTQYFKGE